MGRLEKWRHDRFSEYGLDWVRLYEVARVGLAMAVFSASIKWAGGRKDGLA